jgi:acyl dehydratase
MRSTVPLFARAALGSIPLVPGLAGTRRAGELPNRSLAAEVTIDRDRLAAYDRACGFAFADRIPATYPHVLAFALQLELITDAAFPLPAIGLVHVANAIVQHRPIDASEPLAIAVRTTDLRPHRRGRQFDLVTEVTSGGELVWEERSTNLRIEHRDDRDARPRSEPQGEPLPPVARWRLQSDLGRRYAAVSGDYNPIHLHALTARLFGFPGAIVHGMWTKAHCLAALDSLLPPAYAVEVAFKRPIVLPAIVEYAERCDGTDLAFGVRSFRDGTPHLEGTIRPV